MKILYSELRLFIPSLRVSPKAVVEALSLTGILVDSFTEAAINGKKDYVIGLEVRQNRSDCFGVAGVAREVAAYFGLPFVLPKYKFPVQKKKLQVAVKAYGDVRRVSVIEVDQLDNAKPVPLWLSETLTAHGMNSVSLLVDISNYAMLMTGYPNHIFDAGKVVGGLSWHRMASDDTFTTLDGTVLELTKNKELVVSDNLGPLVLASAVGGRRTAISSRTTSVLGEVAVYDPAKMRSDARGLKVVTEASTRLEKNLSPEFTVWALEFLADCLVRVGGGKVASAVFDHYPKQSKVSVPKITLEADLASRIAGTSISAQESERFLKRLGFGVSRSQTKLQVTVPSWRMDVLDQWDVVEEIIRMKGFNAIAPVAPVLAVVPDVTPPRIRLGEELRRLLSTLGYDEVLTLPMTTSEKNEAMCWEDFEEVRTANAINEELPVLRQGLACGLLDQQHEYLRKELRHIRIFEIGKVFGKSGRRYVEREHLGFLAQEVSGVSAVAALQLVVEQVLRSVGAVRVSFEVLGKVPQVANPHAAWVILIAGKSVGALYQVRDLPLTGNKLVKGTAYAEMDIDAVLEQLSHEKPRGAQELTGKLVVLDANVVAGGVDPIEEKLIAASRVIGKSNIWSLEIVDAYGLGNDSLRYTVRVTYQNVSDLEAKSLHDKAFPAQ